MPNDMFPETARQAVAQVSEQLGRRASALQAQADEAGRDRDVWQRLAEQMSHSWSLHVLQSLRKHRQLIDATASASAELRATIAEIQAIADKNARAVMQRYPLFMEQQSAARGLTLDRTSRHPTYTFEDGFFKVAVDERSGMATLSDYERELARIPADVEPVLAAVKNERDRIFGRRFDAKKVLKRLRQQYLGVIKKEGLSDGEAVPIRHITRRLGKNAKGFRTDEFLVDLSRLLQAGLLEIDGRRLDLQQTKDTSQGMLLHRVPSSGYIGFVIFRRVE